MEDGSGAMDCTKKLNGRANHLNRSRHWMFYIVQGKENDDTVREFKEKLREFEDVNSIKDFSCRNNTLLHYAVVFGNHKTVNVLLDKGADLYLENDEGETPFYLAESAIKKKDCTERELNVHRVVSEKLRHGTSVPYSGNDAQEETSQGITSPVQSCRTIPSEKGKSGENFERKTEKSCIGTGTAESCRNESTKKSFSDKPHKIKPIESDEPCRFRMNRLKESSSDGERIIIGNDEHLKYQGYSEECYIERKFAKETVNAFVKKGNYASSILFITGIPELQLKNWKINSEIVQTIDVDSIKIQKGKKVVICVRDSRSEGIFDRICKSSIAEEIHWLNFVRGDFYWMRSKSKNRERIKLCRETCLMDEDKLIEYVRKSDVVASKERTVIISDDAGMGKSTTITSLIRKIKVANPHAWIGRINLNDYADSENPMSLRYVRVETKPESVISHLMKILRVTSALERGIFQFFLKIRGKVILFLDGFDEISPTYKPNVMRLLKVLIDNTEAEMWLTTRRHEAEELQINTNGFSLNLEKLSYNDQATFMDKALKRKFKKKLQNDFDKDYEKLDALWNELKAFDRNCSDMPRKELIKQEYERLNNGNDLFINHMETLDFTEYFKKLLRSITSSIKDSEFSGLPLHLYMFTNVAYYQNLNMSAISDINILYEYCFGKKIEIYLRDKSKQTKGTQNDCLLFKRQKLAILKDHKRIAARAFQDKCSFPLEASVPEEVEVVNYVGIVRKTDDGCKFVHWTYAEYLFSEWIMGVVKKKKISEQQLKKVLLNERYYVVRQFLDLKLRREKKNDRFRLDWNILKNLNLNHLFRNFLSFGNGHHLKDCMYIWQHIIVQYEEGSAEHLFHEFVEFTAQNLYDCGNGVLYIFQLFYTSLSDKSLSYFIDSVSYYDDFKTQKFAKVYNQNNKNLFGWIRKLPPAAVSEILVYLKRYICSVLEKGKKMTLPTTKQEIEEFFEEIKVKKVKENNWKKACQKIDIFCNTNIIHSAIKNENIKVLGLVIQFLKDIKDSEDFKKYFSTNKVFDATVIKRYLKNNTVEEIFGNVLMCIDEQTASSVFISFCKNIFPFTLMTGNSEKILETFLIIKKKLSKKDIVILIDDNMHKIIVFVRRFVSNIRGNVESFESFLNELKSLHTEAYCKVLQKKSKTCGKNILHFCTQSRSVDIISVVFTCLRETLDEVSLKEFLFQRDKDGNNFLQCWLNPLPGYKDTVLIFQILKNSLKENEFCEILSDDKNVIVQSFLQTIACCWSVYDFQNILKHLMEWIGNEESKEMFLHKLLGCCYSDIRSQRKAYYVLQELKIRISTESYEKLLREKNSSGCNLMHISALVTGVDELVKILLHISETLGADAFKEMLYEVDKHGNNLFFYCNCNAMVKGKIVNVLAQGIKPLLDCDSYREVIRHVDKHRGTLLHLVSQRDECELFDMMSHLRQNLSIDEFTDLLLQKDNSRRNFLQSWHLFYQTENHSSLSIMNQIRECLNVNEFAAFLTQTYRSMWNAYVGGEEMIKGLLQCRQCLTSDALKYMILHFDIERNNLLQHVFSRRIQHGKVKQVLHFVKQCFDDEFYRSLLLVKNQSSQNLLHLYAINSDMNDFQEIMKTLRNLLGVEKLGNMLLESDKNGNHVLHSCVFNFRARGAIFKALLWIKDALSEKIYSEVLSQENNKGRSFLQKIMWCSNVCELRNILQHFSRCSSEFEKPDFRIDLERNSATPHDYFRSCMNAFVNAWVDGYFRVHQYGELIDMFLEKVGKESFVLRLNRKNDNGICIRYLIAKNSDVKEIEEILAYLKSKLNEEFYRKFLIDRDEDGNCFFHWCLLSKKGNGKYLHVLREMGNVMQERALADLFGERHQDGRNLFHLIADRADSDEFVNILAHFKVGRFREVLRDVMKESDARGNNFLHHWFLHSRDHGSVLNIMKEVRSYFDDEYPAFLRHMNLDDRNLLHISAGLSNTEVFLQVVAHCRQSMSPKKFEYMLLEPDSVGRNVLHTCLASDDCDEKVVEFLYEMKLECLSEGDSKFCRHCSFNQVEFLRGLDKNGCNILLSGVKCLKLLTFSQILALIRDRCGIKILKQLLKCKDDKGRNIFHSCFDPFSKAIVVMVTLRPYFSVQFFNELLREKDCHGLDVLQSVDKYVEADTRDNILHIIFNILNDCK